MQIESLRITAPALGLPGYGETEILGAVTWLWMHSPKHRELPLIALSQALLAPLKAQQFILASAAHSGGGFRYLKVGASALLRSEEWRSGDRMWITDWITPFGNAPQFRRIVQAQLADSCFRALYHRSDERGQRIMTMRGDRVSPSVAAAWWQARPLETMRSAPVQ